MTEEQDKKNKIKDILPVLWSSYEHMYTVRETGTTNRIHYLMIVATFLPLFCLTLRDIFQSEIYNGKLFLVPIIFQVVALLILLKSFFVKGQIPWPDLETTLEQLDDNEFEVHIFAELKAAEDETWERMKFYRCIIYQALIFLGISIFLTALFCIIFLTKSNYTLLFFMILLLITFTLILVFSFYEIVPDYKTKYKNGPDRKIICRLPDSKTIINYKKDRYKTKIKRWICKK